MKKACLVILLLAFVCSMAGCGYSELSADAIVTVSRPTPTPIPTPTPLPTPTPEPTPVPEEPAVVTETTPSGVIVTVQNGTYTLTDDVNVREDCNPEAAPVGVAGLTAGTVVNSTGVCENGWIRVDLTGLDGFTSTVGYISGDFVTPAQ